MDSEYVIIGNSAGGIGAAEAIREVDKERSITIISDEPYPAYSRPLISEYVAGERTLERMLFRPPDFYSQNNINLVLDNRVVKLDPKNKTVELAHGERIRWNKCLLATGGKPIIPDIKGLDKKGVFTFLTLDDAKAISNTLHNVRNAVVIGGGLIGISVSQALTERSIKVTVVEMKDRLLNTILDEQAASIAEHHLRQAGVEIITNNTVTQILGSPSVSSVVLDSGDRISCELVVLAIGVLPRTELAVDAGIKVNRGILVDNHMTTSNPAVYACGDAVEAYDFLFGTNRVIPIWPGAFIGGRAAGYNMAGVATEFRGSTVMNSLNYFHLDITTAGQFEPSQDNSEILSKRTDGTYQKIILTDNLITGMIFINEIEKSGIIYGLMRDKINVNSFKEELLSDDFGLAHFPPELRQQRMGKKPEEAVITPIKTEPEEEAIADG
jgi:NAD(P)H-nitrite reductase large subunit